MTQHPTHGCALFPPADAAAPLAAIRARFDPEHAHKIVPHITVKQAFVGPAPESRAERALVHALFESAARCPPLRIRLNSVGVFDSPSHGSVVYANVEGGPALRALSEAMVRTVASYGYPTPGLSAAHENAHYFPHLTLAQGLSPERARHMLDALHAFEARTFMTQRFGVGRCTTDGVWHTPFELMLTAQLRSERALAGDLCD